MPKQKKGQAAKKWQQNRQRCSRNTRKRVKTVKTVKKTREKTRHFIFRSPCPFHASIDPPLSSPLPFSHPDMHHPSTTSWVLSFPPSRLPDWRRCRRPDGPRRRRPALPHLRGLDAPWAPRPPRGAPRQHEGRPATIHDTREKRDTHDKDEKK